MSAARKDLEFYQGDDYDHLFTFKTRAGVIINITGRTYEAEIRQDKKQVVPDATFTTAVNGAAGELLISLTAAQTLPLGPPCTYFWTLRETVSGKSKTILHGKVTVLLPATW